ncbi:MAG: DUF1858 domain-containing protein [Candidatus Polarisedimenticolaceae bacterium]|nr:DUF1858 domain-containing protein [Candidatus Polarisedimenticolaceae bacterium]
MSQTKTDITPSLTVHALLEAYPELEDLLIGMAPPFKRLKNPILRKTVARVATIENIASVGGIPLDLLIGRLREAAGLPQSTNSYSDQDYFGNPPKWFSADKIAFAVDEKKVSAKDGKSLVDIMLEAEQVSPGDIIELTTSFLPAPGIDIMKSKGYSAWSKKEGEDRVNSYFLKNSD